MKNLYIVIFFFCVSISIAEGAASSSAHSSMIMPTQERGFPLNLIMCIDTMSKLSDDPIVFQFALALNHKIAPVMVTDAVLFAYLHTYKDFVESDILKDWHIFKHHSEGIFLLIPPSYIEKQVQLYRESELFMQDNGSYTEREYATGLRIDHTRVMLPIESSYDVLFASVSSSVEENAGLNAFIRPLYSAPLQEILQLFVPGKGSPGHWNISLIGHGSYTRSSAEQAEHLKTVENHLFEFYLKHFDNDDEQAINHEHIKQELDAYNKQFIRYLIAHRDSIFIPSLSILADWLSYKTSYKQNSDGLHNVLLFTINSLFANLERAKHEMPMGRIGGFTIPQFVQFLNFLKTEINTNFFVYDSCFAGGVNLELVKAELEGQQEISASIMKADKPNFIVVAGNTTDTYQYVKREKLHLNQIFPTVYNFTQLFEGLNQFFYGTKTFKGDPFRSILTSFRPTDRIDKYFSSIPLIYIPNTGLFRAVEIDGRVLIITYALATAREFEDMPIDIQNKKVILMYPSTLRVPLVIVTSELFADLEDYPSLISMIPGEASHHLSEIRAPGIASDIFFKKFFTRAEYAYPKTFFVDRLLLKDKVITDLMTQSMQEERKRVYGMERMAPAWVVTYKDETDAGYYMGISEGQYPEIEFKFTKTSSRTAAEFELWKQEMFKGKWFNTPAFPELKEPRTKAEPELGSLKDILQKRSTERSEAQKQFDLKKEFARKALQLNHPEVELPSEQKQ